MSFVTAAERASGADRIEAISARLRWQAADLADLSVDASLHAPAQKLVTSWATDGHARA